MSGEIGELIIGFTWCRDNQIQLPGEHEYLDVSLIQQPFNYNIKKKFQYNKQFLFFDDSFH